MIKKEINETIKEQEINEIEQEQGDYEQGFLEALYYIENKSIEIWRDILKDNNLTIYQIKTILNKIKER